MAYATGRAVPQSDPPRPPRETLPTMYDLPSEFPEEPGLPDEFHDLQPQLLSRTLTLADYRREEWFSGSDLNVYYDVQHSSWHKRPDWFLAVGVPRLYDRQDLRRSYVVWQEGRSPTVVVEFLSPGTEQEDLGRFFEENTAAESANRGADGTPIQQDRSDSQKTTPPDKFTVYETYLRVPYYIVYDRYKGTLRFFQLVGDCYQVQPLTSSGNVKIWLPGLAIGLGLWEGEFEGVTRSWLRWCDRDGEWLLLDTEQEQIAKEQLQTQVLQAARNLLAEGMTLEQVVQVLSLTDEQTRAVEGWLE